MWTHSAMEAPDAQSTPRGAVSVVTHRPAGPPAGQRNQLDQAEGAQPSAAS